MFGYNLSKEKVFIYLYLILSVISSCNFCTENPQLFLCCRAIPFFILIGYYTKNTPKKNYFLLAALFFFSLSAIFIFNKELTIFCYSCAAIARTLILGLLIKGFKLTNIKLFSLVYSSLLIITGLILSLVFKYEIKFILTSYLALATISIICVCFLNFLETFKKWNLYVLSSAAIYICFHLTFTINHSFTDKTQTLFLGSIVNNIGYLLISIGFIKMEKQKKINNQPLVKKD